RGLRLVRLGGVFGQNLGTIARGPYLEGPARAPSAGFAGSAFNPWTRSQRDRGSPRGFSAFSPADSSVTAEQVSEMGSSTETPTARRTPRPRAGAPSTCGRRLKAA